ncbi:hypothetical protein [Lentzea sp. HUAS12]|uniref:hypothetical protein n=1 Tax=Lentzea sp. HUAS12 TaxID=2951806 RepID=UPI00209FFA63|nr:hypothetical protein [Lentzea sp. HUAS12]USX55768.1 hypothetical protein ND450_17215 [Lentzea sp. HUAS12]
MSFLHVYVRETAPQLHSALQPNGVLILAREADPDNEELLRLALERYFVPLRTELVPGARHANAPGTLVTTYRARWISPS